MDDACSIVIPTLETARLWLRPLRRSDLPALCEMLADPQVTRGFGREPYLGEYNVWRFLAMFLGHWHLEGFGMWALEEKATGRFVGYGGFCCPATWPGFELAGALARPYWSTGYAEEAARGALGYAFEVMGRERVISLAYPENARSRRLIDRLGMAPCGEVVIEGRPLDVFGIDRAAYRRTRAETGHAEQVAASA